jgi:hypothetical protein
MVITQIVVISLTARTWFLGESRIHGNLYAKDARQFLAIAAMVF